MSSHQYGALQPRGCRGLRMAPVGACHGEHPGTGLAAGLPSPPVLSSPQDAAQHLEAFALFAYILSHFSV